MVYSKGIVCSVFVLDAAAFGLALAAHWSKHHATITSEPNGVVYCNFHRDAATAMAISAFVVLLVSQMLVCCVSSGFYCAPRMRTGSARYFALLFFALSLLCFAIAEVLFMSGSTRVLFRVPNDNDNFPDCGSLRKAIFSIAATLTFFTLVLTESFYLSYTMAQEKNRYYPSVAPCNTPDDSNGEAAIGMTENPVH